MYRFMSVQTYVQKETRSQQCRMPTVGTFLHRVQLRRVDAQLEDACRETL